MFLIPFLNQRQIGTKSQYGFNSLTHRLNLDNLLSRFVCNKNDAFTVQGKVSNVPPFACKFRRDTESDLLAVANEDGDVLLYNTHDGHSKSLVKSFAAHPNAVFDLCWLPDQCHLLTGSGDHHASLWDISTCSLIIKFKTCSATVRSVDVCNSQSAILATGSRNGNIFIWDTRDRSNAKWHKPAISIINAHTRKGISEEMNKVQPYDVSGSVSCVAFQDYNNLASGGVADGVVKLWDLRKTYVSENAFSPLPRHQMRYHGERFVQHGCTSLVFDSASKKLYGCSTSNKIYQFDCHSYSDTAVIYKGFKCDTYFVKIALSFDDQYLLCGSSDHKAYIWKTTKPGLPIFELPGHTAEVTSVAWNPYTVTKLATCGDDSKVLVWKIGSDENQERNEILYSCSPYSEGSGQVPLFKSNIGALDYQQNEYFERLSLPTPLIPNQPMMKVITCFFSPTVTSHSANSQQNSLTSKNQKGNSDGSKSDQQNFSESDEDSVPSPSSPKSSGNKILSDTGNMLESTPCQETNFDSVIKKAETASPILCCSVQNKENKKSLERTNVNGQTKRKLLLNESAPKFRRCTSGIKEKDSDKVKKEQFAPGRTIMDYFSVDLSPKK